MRAVVEKKISRVFYSIGNAESYVSTPGNLLKRILLEYPDSNIALKDVKEFLSLQEIHQLHRNRRKYIPRNSIHVAAPHIQMCLDLIDFSAFEKYNKGHRFILVAQDMFSRFAYAIPLIRKDSITCLDGIKKVIDGLYIQPTSINTDLGTEFCNRIANRFFRDRGIKHYVVQGHTKNSYCERLIRTLKNRIFKHFDRNLNRKWLWILQDVVSSYNASTHRSIGIPPKDVNIDNAASIYKTYYKHRKIRKKPMLKKGDTVRMNLELGSFSKNYEQSFSRQVYRISDDAIYPEGGIYPTYRIESLNGNHIPGLFYDLELLRVDTGKFVDDFSFPVEKILKRRKGEAFVKFLGYPERDNSWVSTKFLKKIDTS